LWPILQEHPVSASQSTQDSYVLMEGALTLHTHRATLEEGPAAFKKFDSGAAGKFVFVMD
jgi:threonine dehydrogenase-like Zn-dependent dehydrogenase